MWTAASGQIGPDRVHVVIVAPPLWLQAPPCPAEEISWGLQGPEHSVPPCLSFPPWCFIKDWKIQKELHTQRKLGSDHTAKGKALAEK